MRTPGRAARWGTTTTASALLASYLVLAGPPPTSVEPLLPSAGTTYLCSGYKACKDAGYPHWGYKANSSTMYWQMYAGHNCTNYVAYRLVGAGMPNKRPWTGGGNASEWGLYMASITDQTPNEHAIAWWGRYSNGSGSAGHVAYVEKVVSADEIIVSEDSWGGDFHWRSITRSSGRWPTGFIHFIDTPPAPPPPPTTPTEPVFTQTGAPVVSTPLVVDTTVTATAGTWSPTPAENRWRWFADGVRIADNITPNLALTPDLLGKQISLRVVAKQAGYTTYVSPFYDLGPVLAGVINPTAPPTMTGTPALGEVLTATPGAYDQADAAVTYQWTRNGAPIAGATAPSYQLTAEDVGTSVAVQVTAAKPQFLARTETLATAQLVTSPALVTLKTKSKKGRAIAKVRVTAAGKLPVTGKVLVRIGSWKREVRLENGVVKVKVPMARGTKKVRARYLGSTVVPKAPKVTGTVRVR
ncbi:CHAP domain-containing protein [Nocardioides humi]|nr:CHAP domain-containing protein [Nocardioides humi]